MLIWQSIQWHIVCDSDTFCQSLCVSDTLMCIVTQYVSDTPV